MENEITLDLVVGKNFEGESVVFLETKKGLSVALLYTGTSDENCQEWIEMFIKRNGK